jgi:hypothetical protein
VELAGEATHKTQAGRLVADGVQIEPRALVLNAKLETSIVLRQRHSNAVVRRLPDAVLGGVGQELVLDGEAPPENIAADYDIQKTPPV